MADLEPVVNADIGGARARPDPGAPALHRDEVVVPEGGNGIGDRCISRIERRANPRSPTQLRCGRGLRTLLAHRDEAAKCGPMPCRRRRPTTRSCHPSRAPHPSARAGSDAAPPAAENASGRIGAPPGRAPSYSCTVMNTSSGPSRSRAAGMAASNPWRLRPPGTRSYVPIDTISAGSTSSGERFCPQPSIPPDTPRRTRPRDLILVTDRGHQGGRRRRDLLRDDSRRHAGRGVEVGSRRIWTAHDIDPGASALAADLPVPARPSLAPGIR